MGHTTTTSVIDLTDLILLAGTFSSEKLKLCESDLEVHIDTY